jgi:hypothetical protein
LKGNPAAQRKLGFMYYMGYGVPLNYQKANYWFKLAAKKGDAVSQIDLGSDYFYGLGMSKNYKKALYWWKLSANQKYVSGEYNLGFLYYHGGYGIKKNYKTAAHWYKQVANQSHIYGKYSEYMLGYMYYSGELVPEKWIKMHYWYRYAISQEYKVVIPEINAAYHNNFMHDAYKKAVYRFNLAARQGYSLAQAVLGYAYYKGNGITKNYIKALKWFIIARSYGFVFSKKYCLFQRALNNLVKRRLNAIQIKIAVKEAQKYRNK